MAHPLLSVDGIAASYNGAVVALTSVTFEVAPGEILALLGSNGAGKSTILKAVSRLLKAERGALTAGRISFDGADTARHGPGDLVRRGLVPVLEGRHCFRSLTIEDNLVTGGIGRGSSRAEAAADLERIYGYFPRLAEKRRLAAGLASGGEQQMAAIGRALMGRPRLLVLDEPSMGLAPKIVEDIFATLRRLNADEGLTILVAEQNSAVALRHADRAVVIENGVSVLEGPAGEIAARGDIKAFYLGLSALPPPAFAQA
ncbi:MULTISPECIES: ABC transporter ATP-binding protein [unclassified Aureimonas]|uniref:ABC transporter ATP-binding protein n=1 Tax=unclassified Aureimonas TaxID=2615206 RepID=UPI0006FD5423|nr:MULTISPECIES: ABC transporter ATP-binding protein [unclassified Aureimonas]KQT60501.1 ABC transporter ATP-binding protein [Aureimonas sp. Leaf427]KQT79378.1 ABC transporter ATP-binding protein [Aureimonas sp. Leaf460]